MMFSSRFRVAAPEQVLVSLRLLLLLLLISISPLGGLVI
jgi:hypothetical protein